MNPSGIKGSSVYQPICATEVLLLMSPPASAETITGVASVIDGDALDVDRYGRTVAGCSQGGEDLNRRMVRKGWAVAYRRCARGYVGDEGAARRAGRNIWSGSLFLPWDWRCGVCSP
jgi:endonuclease YncB( thermonuclease family)